ncbi:hypothetical protein FKP32DRAFT_1679413 [Trametes sanguinea]|nr:hypothetical protein FKP32DRAFT_1679413 [Trametes sanguinea]
MSELGYNIWGTIAGVVGILGLIPVFLAWLQTRLPSKKLPILIQSHQELETLFATAIRDGLFSDEHDLYQFNRNIWAMTGEVEDIRAEVYAARTWRADVRNWARGLSGRIWTVCEGLDSIKMKLAGRNSHERKRLASEMIHMDLPLAIGCAGSHALSSQSYIGPSGFSLTHPRSPGRRSHQLPLCAPSGLPHPTRRASDDHCLGGLEIPVDYESASTTDERRHTHPSAQPTYHLVSDTDLQGLVSMALSRPSPPQGGKSRTVNRGGHGRPHGPRSSRKPSHENVRGKSCSDGIHISAALLRLVRRAYGVRLPHLGSASADRPFDPESLAASGPKDNASDPDVWEDV